MTTRRTVIASSPLFAAQAAALAAAEFGLDPRSKSDQSAALQKAIDTAIAKSQDLYIPPGSYVAGGLVVTKPLRILGTPGLTALRAPAGDTILSAANVKHLTFSGLTFDGLGAKPLGDAFRKALVMFSACENLHIEACRFLGSEVSGLSLEGCAGRVTGCEAGYIAETGIFAFNSKGIEISGCFVHDIGNNGIQIWREAKEDDGAIVTGNRVERIAAKGGGSGQNGNGINIWKAAGVIAANNTVRDCAFSAIRNNSGDMCQIISNNCARCDETAIYVEFAYEGAIVSNNIIDGASTGISITNLNDGGRLAVCSGNLVRNIWGPRSNPESTAVGIHGEGEVAITGNVVEKAQHAGINLGWGRYGRNLSAVGNTVSACAIGIAASLSEGAMEALIANNVISGSTSAAIMGMDHKQPVTGDLALPDAEIPARLKIVNNLVT